MDSAFPSASLARMGKACTHLHHKGKARVLWSDSDVEMVALDQAYLVNDDNIDYICETKHILIIVLSSP